MSRPSWWGWFHPSLTWQLIVIVLFLTLVTLSSIAGIIGGMQGGDTVEAASSAVRAMIFGLPAYGLFRMRRWARKMELMLAIFAVALGLILIFIGVSQPQNREIIPVGAFIVAIHGLIAIYLLSAGCRRAFGLLPPPPAGS